MEHTLSTGSHPTDFGRRAAVAVALVVLVVLVWYTAKVFLLVFAGVLVAVFLDFVACKLASATRVGRGWAFAAVTVVISVLFALVTSIALPRIANQLTDFIRSLPEGLGRFQSYLGTQEWGRELVPFIPNLVASSQITERVSTLLKEAVYAAADLTVIVVVGIYLGASPSLYQRATLRLFPAERRESVRRVLAEIAYTLRWWIIGQLIPMAVLGTATIVGLRLLHVRLAFTLGLFTAFMIFIPYIGSIIALLVTILATLIQGANTVLYVTLLFIGIHVAEGYLLTPMVQRRAVYLPPALTIVSQVLLGLLLGFMGLALATPITAASLVLVKMLYLGEQPEHHSWRGGWPRRIWMS